MVKTPSKSTAATVAETAAKVMRKGRSKKKSAKEPEDEEDGDRGISETESSDEEWGTITAFKYKKGLPKLPAEVGMEGTDDYLAVLDHLQGMKEGFERHMNSVGARSNLWELCMTPTFGLGTLSKEWERQIRMCWRGLKSCSLRKLHWQN